MIDYGREAARYDVTRGGGAQASAAADAIESLLPRPRCGSLTSAAARESSPCVCSGPAFELAEIARRGVFLGQAVQGNEDALVQDHTYDGGFGQLTPGRLRAEAERRMSAPED